MPDRTDTPQARRSSAHVQDAIVQATIQLIGEGGVAAVTHRAVADAAGVSLSSTTYHFATKSDIVEAALHRVITSEIERLQQISAELVGVHDVPTLAAALAEWMEAQLTAERNEVRTGYELALEADRSPGLQQVHAEWGEATLGLGELALRRAGAADPVQDAPLLVAFVEGLRLGEVSNARPGVAARCRPLVERFLGLLIP